MTRLTCDEVNTMINALRVAAERFGEHVKELLPQHRRLADQFEKQQRESLALADKLENAEHVTLEVLP